MKVVHRKCLRGNYTSQVVAVLDEYWLRYGSLDLQEVRDYIRYLYNFSECMASTRIALATAYDILGSIEQRTEKQDSAMKLLWEYMHK